MTIPDHSGPCDSALEELRRTALSLKYVQISPYAYGQEGVFHQGLLIGHLHRSGVVGLACSVAVRDTLIQQGLVRPHHDNPDAPWIILTLDHPADLALAARLLREAWQCQAGQRQRIAYPSMDSPLSTQV
ncbi:hypothetical protein EHF33_16130 [Deinococcus psychrotolerans]|uniref:Luciferase domain-containing protein n=1 Tax=Deinococcus psychrotolerans TaxID=2489213 RepID=A0A3G8YHD3_9DEIO|nr:luciferase family protein [Deinococcus psychrotolerans]AZI44403.1 hypothetical protein EHF33_16130 [Deinococcus psychrotolerans]